MDLDICIRGKNYGTNLHVSEIKNALYFDKYNIDSEKYNGSWLFMDRIEYADDNAEHLYRYIMNNRLRNKIFFVLDKNSSDWARLYDEGFSLLEYGSKSHEIALRNCSVIISSHAGFEQIDYFRDGSLKFKKFVFLQHGVTKDDLHKWLNGKKIDLFVTTTQPEYNSIVNDDFNYRFTKKEVKFLGFPRFDYLFNHIGEAENYILVTPTWRSYLDENSFDESVYKKYWFSFLFSEKLSDLCLKYNYRVIIQPHPNIRKFITRKEISPYISFSSGEKYQDLFIKSKILITDYSSTAFDMAYMNKAVLYYQFDEKEFFSGVHTYQKGYFDYRKDGFGPVSTNTDELLLQLEELMKIGKVPEVYKNRIDETFTLRDSNNCERCFNAICNLFGYQNTDEQ